MHHKLTFQPFITQKSQPQNSLDIFKSFVHVPSAHSLYSRIFGSTAYVHLPKGSRHKIEARAIKYVIIGYGSTQKRYHYFDPNTKRVITTMDHDFFEIDYYYTHLSCQGESASDDLSWLSYPIQISQDTTEKVRDTI